MQKKYHNEKTYLDILDINPEPIGLFTFPLSKHIKYKNQLKLIYENASNDLRQEFHNEKNVQHICNISNQNLFNSFSELNELKSDLQKFVLTYIEFLGYECDEIIINSAWLNKSDEKSTLAYHNHCNSYISANYFINYNPDLHSSLTFRNDRASLGRNQDFPFFKLKKSKKKSIYNSDVINIDANEGQVIVWRSNQSHGYFEPNKANGRMTLSLNSLPRTIDDGLYKFTISE